MLLQFRNVKVEDHIKSISKNNSGYHLNCKSKVPYNSYPCVVKVVKAAPSSQPKCLIFTVLLFLSQQGSLHPQPPPPHARALFFCSFLLSPFFSLLLVFRSSYSSTFFFLFSFLVGWSNLFEPYLRVSAVPWDCTFNYW